MRYDLVIVGGGPAGLTAALTASQYGVSVAIIDENPTLGGKLLGQLHEDPNDGWWIGQQTAQELTEKVQKAGVDILLGCEVWGVFPSWQVMLSNGEKISASYLLLATGAAEHTNPLPGWTKPGVIGIGAAQTLNNYYRVKVGHKVAIVGVDPLAMTVAHELKMAGIDVVGIYLPSNYYFSHEKSNPENVMRQLMGMAHLAPGRFLRLGKYFKTNAFIQRIATKFYPKKGIKVWGIPLYLKKAVNNIMGDGSVTGIQTIELTASGELIPKSEQTIEVDAVCISGRLYPLTELASALGCEFAHIEELGGHIPIHSSELETSIENVFVAGNITGIESAKVSMAQGELVGQVISNRLKLTNDDSEIKNAIKKVAYEREHALLQFQENVIGGRQRQSDLWNSFDITRSKKEVTH